jgi:hypothetical protein
VWTTAPYAAEPRCDGGEAPLALVSQRHLIRKAGGARTVTPHHMTRRRAVRYHLTPGANTLACSSSSSRCRTILSAGLTVGREPRREQLTGHGVGQVGPGQGDADAGQVRLVAEGEVDRLVARRELALNACSERKP